MATQLFNKLKEMMAHRKLHLILIATKTFKGFAHEEVKKKYF